MKSNTNLHRLTAFLLTACALAVAPITVNNHSFETLAAAVKNCPGTGCLFDEGPLPGWTSSSVSGSWQPGIPLNPAFFNFIPDGNLIGYVNSGAWNRPLAPLYWRA